MDILYCKGTAQPEVYVEKPFDYKVLKADLDKYFDADEDLIKCTAKDRLLSDNVRLS